MTVLQIGGQRELYHFELGESEQLTMKTDSPYISKSDDLFSQVNVSSSIISVYRIIDNSDEMSL